MKLSRDKISAPGRKQVFRRSKPFSDVLGLRDEPVLSGRQRLLERLMKSGKRTAGRQPWSRSLELFQSDLASLPASAKDIRAPKPPTLRSTDALRKLTADTRSKLIPSAAGRGRGAARPD
jgi:nicotinate phosphoribosyltransferase